MVSLAERVEIKNNEYNKVKIKKKRISGLFVIRITFDHI